MQFMLLLYQDEVGFWFKLNANARERAAASYELFVAEMQTAGVLRGGSRFESFATAKTVRAVDGAPSVSAGAYADTPEQLGGYFIVEVADFDAALSWAARCPTIGHGVVEVRQLFAPPG